MNSFFSELLAQVQNDLQKINLNQESNLKHAEEAYKILNAAYQKLKQFVAVHTFGSDEEEIHYFKVLKPQITSHLIYHLRVYHVETKKPQGSNHAKKSYFLSELDHIQTYFSDNLEFVQYYRANESYLDHIYFLRNKLNFKKTTDIFSIELDQTQGTDYDYRLACIQANERLQTYLCDEMALLESGSAAKPVDTASGTIKIESGLSVAQIAVFYKLQMDTGVITHKAARDVVHHISENYRTSKTHTISSESIRTKFYTYDDAAIEAVKDKIIAMLNRIREI